MLQSTPHHPITSKENVRFKRLLALTETKTRKKEKAFLIEGVKTVEEALRDDLGVELVIAAPSLLHHQGKGVLKLAESRGIEVLWAGERLIDALSESKTPQPVMAVAEMKQCGEEDILSHRSHLVLVAHRLQDPGNLGTIIRTAEAAGASGIVLTANTVDAYNAKAVRASMGSILRVPLLVIPDFKAFMKRCRQRGFQTVAAVLKAEKSHFDPDFTKPTVVVLGREGSGLTPDETEAIDIGVRIPMAPAIDSLNVATAAAVILYEAVRQRTGK